MIPTNMKSTSRFFLFSLLTIFVCTILLSFSPAPADSLDNDILSYTNKFRKSKSKTDLVMREDLNALAEQHSADMAKGRVGFGHGGFDSRQARAKKALPNMTQFAENVAYGAKTAKEVVNGWKNSSGHRKNMLGNYKYIGIGTAKDKKGTIYYTQIFAN